MRMATHLLSAPMLTLACASLAPMPPDRVAAGLWGGEHVALTVTDSGASLEFDCASGEIPQALSTDAAGRFAADGVFVRQRPGAQRIGDEPDRQQARYEGRLAGNTLTFEVILTESKQTVGTFTVERGATPRVRKCR